jgi:hypothetical protein
MVGILKFGIRDPESVRDPFQCATIFFWGLKALRDIIICKYFEKEMDKVNILTHTRKQKTKQL